jgi:thioredoxin-related protein
LSQALFSSPKVLASLLQEARAGAFVVAALYSSDNCPWCVSVKKEQLAPRMRAGTLPKLRIVEFNADADLAFLLPDRSKKTARQWAASLGFRVMPTLAMLDERAMPIGEPLIGYASPDFYAAYLEDKIKAAQTYWQTLGS